MSAWADYVEWSGLDESKLRHPAGKGVPESPEVAEARMDAEAVALANSGRKRPLPGWVGGLLLGLWIYTVIVGLGIAAGMAAGWTL